MKKVLNLLLAIIFFLSSSADSHAQSSSSNDLKKQYLIWGGVSVALLSGLVAYKVIKKRKASLKTKNIESVEIVHDGKLETLTAGDVVNITIKAHLKDGSVLVTGGSDKQDISWNQWDVSVEGGKQLSNGSFKIGAGGKSMTITAVPVEGEKVEGKVSLTPLALNDISITEFEQNGRDVSFYVDGTLTNGKKVSTRDKTLNLSNIKFATSHGSLDKNYGNAMGIILPKNMLEVDGGQVVISATIVGNSASKKDFKFSLNYSGEYKESYSGSSGGDGSSGKDGGYNKGDKQDGQRGFNGRNGENGQDLTVKVDLVNQPNSSTLIKVIIEKNGVADRTLLLDPTIEGTKINIYSNGGKGGSGGRGGTADTYDVDGRPVVCGDGGDGGDGGEGGDGGDVQLIITNKAKKFADKINVFTNGGSGGYRGRGGSDCSCGSTGCGASSAKGRDGQDGTDGRSGKVTTKFVESL